ncbi:MAG TPA: hypothetical protein VFG64_15540 [Dongiaceae bacterium]|nr:hypothetical protein [Dongiaceae bacterium]
MDRPSKAPGTRLCIALRKQGITLYGNPAAMRSLAEHLLWIAHADPAEHYECHAGWQLQSDECLFNDKHPLDVWMLVEPDLAGHVTNGNAADEVFDINFMAVEEGDLDELAKHQGSGILPKEP